MSSRSDTYRVEPSKTVSAFDQGSAPGSCSALTHLWFTIWKSQTPAAGVGPEVPSTPHHRNASVDPSPV